MPFDPDKPAENSPNSSEEMREQLTSLKALIDAGIAGTANNPTGVTLLDFEPADPPSMGEIWLIYNKLNEVIAALKREP